MPTDASGVHSLPDGYLAVTGTTVLASQHNPPLEDLSASMTQRLMRSGVSPMTGPLKSADGTVSAPGLTMASAPSSGWYKTTDGWGFSLGGVQVVEITSGGIRTGARYIGELIPFSGSTAPSQTVFPFGQTLSRATYPALWTFAQGEIASGNTFYNNGNGTTTFGIGDCRGRSFSTKDDLGGSASNRITSGISGINGLIPGSAGGAQSYSLVSTQIPSHTHSGGTGAQSANHQHSYTAPVGNTTTGGGGFACAAAITSNTTSSENATHTHGFTTDGGAVGGAAVAIMPPTMIVTHLLFAGA